MVGSGAQRVFVTGATGVVGRRVVAQLQEAGHEVTAVARSDEKAALVTSLGASPATVDIFDEAALAGAMHRHDAVLNLATHIPTGVSAGLPWAWRENDRIRTAGSAAVVGAARAAGVGRVVQESITFPYDGAVEDRIVESSPRSEGKLYGSCQDAETAALGFDGEAVVLRFALFWAPEGDHTTMILAVARRGLFALIGDDDAWISFVHADDAASAAVAALEAPAGVYNVAESEPTRRREHREVLAQVVGRDSLRSVPKPVYRLAGAGAAALARSHRISAQKLADATNWEPTSRAIESWKDLA